MAEAKAARTTGKVYKVTNWKEYNESLVRRGDVTLWLEDDVILGWQHENAEPKVGRPFTYSDEAIRCLLSLREVFGLTYRQTEGFARSLVKLLGASITIPDYTSLQKRAAKIKIALCTTPKSGALDVVVDSTGLKIYGEGEWKMRQHGVSKRRSWRKIHIGIDPATGEIIAEESTGNDAHDADQVEGLVAQVDSPIETFYGDGAYDQRKVYDLLECEAALPIIPPRKNAKIWRHGNTDGYAQPRDEAVRAIRRVGRRA